MQGYLATNSEMKRLHWEDVYFSVTHHHNGLTEMHHRSWNFHVKNKLRENFRVVKFSRFRSIREIFLTVDNYNILERMESSYRLVYYRVSDCWL